MKKISFQFMAASCIAVAGLCNKSALADISQQWSPLTIGGEVSSQFGPVANIFFANNIINSLSALGLQLAIGGDEFRFNGTYGYALTPTQRLKFTAEYMSQNIDFNFNSGKETNRMGQTAFGAGYQYLFANTWVKNITLSGYLASASSDQLANQTYQVNGVNYTNLRNFAGANSRGLAAQLTVSPWSTAEVGLTANYDYVNYDAKNQSIGNENGLGYTVNLTQLLCEHFKIMASASQRQPYNQYQGNLAWLVPTAPGSMLELSMFASRITGNLPMSGDNRVGISMTYSWNGDSSKGAAVYSIAQTDAASSIVPWVMQPAVRAPQPFVALDQANK